MEDRTKSLDFIDSVINLLTSLIWYFKRIISKRIMEELEKKVNVSQRSALSFEFDYLMHSNLGYPSRTHLSIVLT